MQDPKHNAKIFGKVAAHYADQYFNDTFDIPFINEFLKYVTPGGRILDVACGPGMFSKHMLGRGYKVEGIDLSPEMVGIAQKLVPGVEFSIMDMRELSYTLESFDGLLVAYALIFIPSAETEAVLSELGRVLKPGGHALFITQKGKPDHIENEPLKPNETLLVNFFQPEQLNNHLRNAKLTTIEQKIIETPDADSMSKEIIFTIAKKV